jgi:hypothetical protein
MRIDSRAIARALARHPRRGLRGSSASHSEQIALALRRIKRAEEGGPETAEPDRLRSAPIGSGPAGAA